MVYVFYRKGYALKELLNLSWTGAKTSIIVMQIFLLIGWLIAMWQAAGVIHSDFYDKFISAKIISFTGFVSVGGWQGAKEAGKIRQEGRDYIMQDGDVVEFMIGRQFSRLYLLD